MTAASRTAGQLEAMFTLSDSAMLPDDPVLARLLPDAYPDDAAAAGEFRRYTESGLRSGKVAAARTVLDTLPEDGRPGPAVRRRGPGVAAFAQRHQARAGRSAWRSPRTGRPCSSGAARAGSQAAGLWMYDWLTLLQETLVEALW